MENSGHESRRTTLSVTPLRKLAIGLVTGALAVCLIVVTTARRSEAAGPGYCIAGCYHQYNICLASHGGYGLPDAHGAAVTFCLPLLNDCIQLCVVATVLLSYFSFASIATIVDDGTQTGVSDKAATVFVNGWRKATKLLDRSFEKTLGHLQTAIEESQAALAAAQDAGHPSADLELIDAAGFAARELVRGLDDVTNQSCYAAAATRNAPPPADLVGPFVLTEVLGPTRVDPDALLLAPDNTLRRHLERAAKALDKVDSKYETLHQRAIDKTSKLAAKIDALAIKGHLDQGIASQLAIDFAVVVGDLANRRALRACLEPVQGN